MKTDAQYLYTNSSPVAERRLRALEAIEDESTIKLLSGFAIAPQWHCLEVGAGAGSIARWLAGRCSRTVATDLDTRLLDPDAYEVWPHDILKDAFPQAVFDIVHFRHVLIHIDRAKHLEILRSLCNALIPGGVLLAEESDMETWRVSQSTPEPVRSHFGAGIAATLAIYRSRGMNPALGMELERLIQEAGFVLTRSVRRTRQVTGGTAEAHFQQTSARQLAESIRILNPNEAVVLDRFAACFDEQSLEYETRATVSVSAARRSE
jgi:SAM-dependent methyltransferase